MTMKAEGWAVIEDMGLDMRSVSPTRRAAIVNWLVTRKGCWVSSATSDEKIEADWSYWTERCQADVVPVIVHTISTPASDERAP